MIRRLLMASLLLAACNEPAPSQRPDRSTPPVFGCPVTLEHRHTGALVRVFAAGEWNGFSTTTDELAGNGTGTFRKTLTLPPGEYAYKLHVTGDGREPWRLDPDNPYRSTHGGIENSGLRVGDCEKPAIRVVSAQAFGSSGTFRAELSYDPRRAGPPSSFTATITHDGDTRALTSDEATLEGTTLKVAIDALPPGKYAVRVNATSTDARAAREIVMPFWSEPKPFSWAGATLYMAMTDRYRNGDPANDGPATDASRGAGWVGGDLDGVRLSIEDGTLDSMGVRALWLTPFNTNPEGTETASDETKRVSGYHGYWPIEPRSVDPRLGGEKALHALVKAAHAKGIRVLMDAVVNHVHEDHPYVREHPEWFNRACVCGTPGCDWTERRLDCLFRPYLPDVDWTRAEARQQFVDDAIDWVDRFDLDGLRVDAVKHVPDLAVRNLSVRLRERFETAGTRLFLMGETAMGWDAEALPDAGGNIANYDTISRYVGPYDLDGQFDFPLYYAASLSFLADAPGRGPAHVDYWSRASQRRYPQGAVMTPYLGSHDVSRFLSLSSDPARAFNQWDNLPGPPSNDDPYDRMYVAFGWLLSQPGMPLVYMGDEYGDFGGMDPDNRHPWRPRAELSSREQRQLDRVSALGRARRALAGFRSTSWRTLIADDETLVTVHGADDEKVIVMLQRSPRARELELDVPADVAIEGTRFTDELDGSTSATVTRAALRVSLAPWSVRYLRR